MTAKFPWLTGAALVVAAGMFLTGCGTASADSKYQSAHGIAPSSGYPGGQANDPGSPALSSSTETKYSRDQAEKEEPAHAAESSNK